MSPKKSKSGQRLYSSKDVETIEEIKQLLYVEKLTIDGARKRLAVGDGDKSEATRADVSSSQSEQLKQILRSVVAQLQDVRNSL